MRHRPHQGYCSRCVNAGTNCDLNFEEMRPMPVQGPYSYAVILVICKEFKQKER